MKDFQFRFPSRSHCEGGFEVLQTVPRLFHAGRERRPL